VRRLVGSECDLPVPVTEFVGHLGNCYAFGPSTPADHHIFCEIDALTPAFVLTRESSASPLMQLVLRRVNQVPGIGKLKDRITIGHISGEANVTGDLPSRGRFAELAALYHGAGFGLTQIACPPQVDSILAELVLLHTNIRARHATSLGVHNLGMYGPPLAHVTVQVEHQQTFAAPFYGVRSSGPVAVDTARVAASPVTSAPPATVTQSPLQSPLSIDPTPTATALVDLRMEVHLPSSTPLETPATAVPSAPPPQWRPALFPVDPRICRIESVAPQAGTDVSAPVASSLSFEATVALRLASDTSEYALRPADPHLLSGMCAAVFCTQYDNRGSTKKLDSNLKLWRRYTEELNTPMWRPPYDLLDANSRERESVLAANFVPWALRRMLGRRGPRAKPISAYKAYLGVRKAHQLRRNVEMTPTKLVWTMVKRLNRRHLEDFGASSLIIQRKQPFTRDIFHALLVADGKHGSLDLDSGPVRAAFRAFASIIRQTGMRKSELALQSHETFSAKHASRHLLTWCLRGVVYASPPDKLLRSPQAGDYAILVPPPSKADQFGEVWGALPIYLHYDATQSDAAFHHLAQLELAVPVPAADRAAAPLISADGVKPFTGSQLDTALKSLLRPIVGAPNVRKYSWHSGRIYLACALLASGATCAQIQSLCRWQTEDSLRIYARLNPQSYHRLLQSAAHADVSSVSTASLPPLSSELALRQLLGLPFAEVSAAA